METLEPKKEELILCRLCGKNKPKEHFMVMTLAKLSGVAINYNGCRDCEKVIHNATVIVKETCQREMAKIQELQGRKIVMPGRG